MTSLWHRAYASTLAAYHAAEAAYETQPSPETYADFQWARTKLNDVLCEIRAASGFPIRTAVGQ